MATGKLKTHKSLDVDQIPAELFKACLRIFRYKIHCLINTTWNKKGLPCQWKGAIFVPVYSKGDKTDPTKY
jgi:hypothetical protein